MASKQKRVIGDAREEMDPKVRAERDGEWAAKNMETRDPSSLGASRWNPKPATPVAPATEDAWRLNDTRLAIFARMKRLEGGKALTREIESARVTTARRKVYEDMYATGCESNSAAAVLVNVEYFVDARLWTDHVQTRTSEAFPWAWPSAFREDEGYAAFIASKASRDKWTANVLEDDETTRVRRQTEKAETEAKLKAEGKDWADISAPINETHRPTEDKDGNRVVGEPQLVVRTKPKAAEPAKEEAAGKAAGKVEDTPWGPEQMTELYQEMFRGGEPLLHGMGGFELPMEESLAAVVTKGSVAKADMLFPGSIEVRPVTLGWGRVKLCLRFAAWVTRDKDDFPVHKYYLVWSWCMLLKWKGRLLGQASDAEETMYDGIRWVVDRWTEQAGKKQADLSVVDEAWLKDARDDRDGLEDEATKQRLYDAVSKVLASSRGQDDEARACGVVDWADADPEEFGAGPRTRTYLAVEAMCRYCASKVEEEKLGMIAQQMKSEKHAAPTLLKKRAGQAAKSSKPGHQQ